MVDRSDARTRVHWSLADASSQGILRGQEARLNRLRPLLDHAPFIDRFPRATSICDASPVDLRRGCGNLRITVAQVPIIIILSFLHSNTCPCQELSISPLLPYLCKLL